MPGGVSTADNHERTAGEVRTVFLPELWEGRPVWSDFSQRPLQQHEVVDRWPSAAVRRSPFVLSVEASDGLHGQQNGHMFLQRMRAAEIVARYPGLKE